MKRLLIIIIIMLVVVGGGIGGLMYMDIVPNPFAPAEDEMSEGGGVGDGGPPAFVPPERASILYPLEDLVIPVIMDGRVIKRVYITGRIEIAPGNRPAVENGIPRLESELNQRLILYFQNHFAVNRRPDPRGIKRVMVGAAQHVYGDMVSDVLLNSIFEQ